MARLGKRDTGARAYVHHGLVRLVDGADASTAQGADGGDSKAS